ncbi:MAG: hypothetical protein ACOC9P_00665 [bacterium]
MTHNTPLAPTGRQMLLEALASQGQPYEPRLDVVTRDGGYWIRDHQRPIAWIHGARFTLDAFEFSPFTTLGRELTVSPRYDMGTYINMHATLLQPGLGGPFGAMHGRVSPPHWDQSDPRELHLFLRSDYSNTDYTECTLTIGYDDETGQYLYRVHKTVNRADPATHEFCNVYPRDLGNGIPGQKKWQHTVWLTPEGRLRRFPQTPALTCQFGVADLLSHKKLASDGFIGWGTEPEFNLALLFEHATAPLCTGTCDQWYDEHLCFDGAGLAAQDGCAEVTFRLVNVPAETMHRFVKSAAPTPISDAQAADRCGPAFVPGRINELERTMDPNVPQAGQVWPIAAGLPNGKVLASPSTGGETKPLPCSEHVHWADDCGHSGTRSIYVRGETGHVLYVTPAGPNFHTAPNTCYRFDGWIRTRGARAWLRLERIWQNWKTSHGTAESEIVETDEQWTHVSATMNSMDFPYMLCRLVVEGDGSAWFDDLRFDQVL